MNVVARDVVDCLEVFVPLPGALSTVEPATRVHAVNSFDVRLLAVAFAFAFFCLSWLSCRTGGGRGRPPPAAPLGDSYAHSDLFRNSRFTPLISRLLPGSQQVGLPPTRLQWCSFEGLPVFVTETVILSDELVE